jgi:hypothetical protein
MGGGMSFFPAFGTRKLNSTNKLIPNGPKKDGEVVESTI